MPRFVLRAGLLAALLLTSPAPVPAQQPSDTPQARIQAGIDAAARGDTVQALAILDELVNDHPELAEAHFTRAQIYASMASGKATQFDERLEAQAALEQAIRRDPHNPMYLLELGKLMLMQQVRLDARRLFDRALDEAARADATTLAEVHYQLGLFHETQWVRFRDRHLYPPNRSQVDTERAFNDAEYAWDFLSQAAYPGPDQGAEDRTEMLLHYRSALRAYPGHAGAATHMLAYLHDEGSWEEYEAIAQAFVAASPSDPRGYLGLGLGLYRQGMMDEAAGAFHYALSLMPEAERREVEAIGRILRKDDERGYDALTVGQRSEYQRRYWALSDPLHLTEINEYWLEYMARLAYVDFRFAVPEYRLRGWQTDRGDIYLRYGPPEIQATFGASTTRHANFTGMGKVTTVWSYGKEGPVFVFRQNPGFRNARFADDFEFYSEDLRARAPARFESPSLPERYALPIQVVRFRGPDGRMDIEVHAALPLDSLTLGSPVGEGSIQSGLFVQDGFAREVERAVREEEMGFRGEDARRRLDSWRISLPPEGTYVVAVEAREPVTWKAAVGRSTIESKAFPAGQLAISDILLAHEVEPLTESPATRSDFRIAPNAELSFPRDAGVHLYFELYNLLPDDEQYASYEVELRVTIHEIERGGPALVQQLAELADKWGFTKEGTSPADLRFEKQARVLARDMVPEFFNIALPGAPPGRYTLDLIVRDRNSGREAETSREFRIQRDEGATP